jgi:hypothetical protein
MNPEYIRLNKVLKQLDAKRYNGYSIKALIQTELVYLIYKRYKPFRQFKSINILTFIRKVRLAAKYDDLHELCKKYFTILSILHERKDHVEFMERIKDKISNAVIYKNNNLTLQKHYKIINLYVSIINISLLYTLSIKEKIHLIVILTHHLNTLHLLEETFKGNNHNNVNFVAFNGPYGNDAILTEFFNKLNVNTYSIQHGIYYRYKNFIPYDIINYLFVNTQKILCWGSESIDVLAEYGVDKKKCIIAGNPKYNNYKIQPFNKTFKTCIVMLGRFIYHEENLELLKLLNVIHKQTEIIFFLKLHPSLEIKSYLKDYQNLSKKYNFQIIDNSRSLTEVLKSDKYNFSIAYNTGAYIESYLLGKISLRFSKNENETIRGLDDKFKDYESFINRINYFKQTETDNLYNLVFEMVDSVLGISYDRYKFVLNN